MPFVENYQPVRGAQGRESVGYRNGSPACRQLAERFLYLLFGLGVERGCRFVEDYYLRVVKYRPRDSYALALAAGELVAFVADARVVAVGQLCYKVVRVRYLRRLYDLLKGRVRLGVGDVFQHVAVEKKSFLQHHAHLRAQAVQVYLLDVNAVDAYLALRAVVKPQDKVYHSRFADARVTDYADHLALLYAASDVFKHRVVRFVAEVIAV